MRRFNLCANFGIKLKKKKKESKTGVKIYPSLLKSRESSAVVNDKPGISTIFLF